GSGSLSSLFGISTIASSETALVTGNYNLFNLSTSTISVHAGTTSSGIDLDMQAVMTNGGFEKYGDGVLNLSNSNTFTQGVTIDGGVVRIQDPGALNS